MKLDASALGEIFERLRVNDALGTLPAAQRQAVQLRIVDELSYAEAAGRLGVSQQAVRAWVSRGLKALGAALLCGQEVGDAAR